MGAVDIGIGHDDDPLVAEVFLTIFVACAAAQRLDQVGDLLVGHQLVAAGAADIEDLAAQRQDRLVRAVSRLLGRAAGRVTFDDEEFGTLGRVLGAIRELARQAQLAHRALAVDFLFLATPQTLLGALDHPIQQLGRLVGIVSEIVIEGIAERVFDNPLRLDRRQLVLGLADKLRFADKDRQHADGRDHHIVRGDLLGALVLCQLRIVLEALGERDAQARLMGAAFGVGMVLQ